MKKIYKSILAISLLIGLANKGEAQVASYAFSQNMGTYAAITGGSVIASATANTAAGSMDDAVYNLPNGTFPFTFTFNGIGYTGCNISSNGFITFGTTAPGGTNYTPISGAALFAGSIAAWGGDVNSMFSIGTSSVTGEIRYEVIGTAPNREIVIQYSNWRPSYSTSTTNAYALNYQIRLEETSNKVSIIYGTNGYVVGSTVITNTRQVGLRGATNADYNNRLNSASVSFTASTQGSANSSTQTFSTTGTTPGMPVNGLTYVWTPPIPCSGTPNAGTAIASQTSICTPANVNLNLSGSTGGVTGLTYQWYSSPDGSIWNAVSTATTMATTQSVTATTYYQAVVSCGASSATSTPVQVMIASTTTNTVPYFEGFEGISVTNQLPNCSWMISNPTICQTYTTSGTNNRIPRTGTKFGSFRYGTNTAGDYFYTNGIQLTAGVNYIASAYYVTDGASGWSEFSLLYGASQSTTALTGIASVTGTLTNMAYNNLSGTFSVSATGTYYIALKAIGNSTPWYLSIDDISVNVAPTCTTTPVAGTISGPTVVNIGTTNTYSISPAVGNLQWWSAPTLTGPWNPIGGATNSTQTITATSSGTVYYGVIASSPGCPNDTTNVQHQVTVLFPGNDVCDAIPLTIGTSAPYYLAGATTQTGEVVPPGTGCTTNNSWCNTTLNNSMWFTFTAPASGYVSIHPHGFDTQLALWKAANCNDLLSSATATLVAANDDDAAYSAHSGVQYSSYLEAACLTPGMTYYIQLDSYSAATPTESTTIVITDMGSLNTSFTGLAANYCLPASSSSLTPATMGGVFTVNTSTTAITSFSPSTAGSFTVTYSIFGCQSMSTTVVANTPTVMASTSSTAICAGQSATLTATGATNYTWTPVGGMTATAVVSPTVNASYTVTGEDNGCTAMATVSVDVNASPTLSVAASSGSICAGSSATLTASGATNYTWTPTGDMTATAVVSPTANATYTVMGEAAGCTGMTTVNVDVNGIPVVGVSPMSSTICAGTSLTLTATGADTYAWSNGDLTATSVVSPTANATYTVTGTNACGSDMEVAMIDVTSSPVVNAMTTSTLICAGETVTLTATGSASYTWAPGGETTDNIVVSPSVTTVYTVTGSSTCGTATTTIQQDVSLCTGIANIAVSSNVSLFPNPNNGFVTINIAAELTNNSKLEVYDALGKLVMSENLSNESNTINTSKLDTGIYIYKVINNNQEVKVGKMIKQ